MPPKRNSKSTKSSATRSPTRAVPSTALSAFKLLQKGHLHKALKEIEKALQATTTTTKETPMTIEDDESFDSRKFDLACAHYIKIRAAERAMEATTSGASVGKAGEIVWAAIMEAMEATKGTCAAVNAACGSAYLSCVELSAEVMHEAKDVFETALRKSGDDVSTAEATRSIRREFDLGRGENSMMRYWLFDASKEGNDYSERMMRWPPASFRHQLVDNTNVSAASKNGNVPRAEVYRMNLERFKMAMLESARGPEQPRHAHEAELLRKHQEHQQLLDAQTMSLSSEVSKHAVPLFLPDKQRLTESEKKVRQQNAQMIRYYWGSAERKAQELSVSVDAVKAEIINLKHNEENEKSMELSLRGKKTLCDMLDFVANTGRWTKFTCPKCASEFSNACTFREHISKHYPMSLNAAGVEISADTDVIFSKMQIPGDLSANVGENVLAGALKKDMLLSADFDILEPRSIQDFKWLQRAEEGSSVKNYRTNSIKDTVDNVPDFVAPCQVVRLDDVAQKWRFPDNRASAVHIARKRVYYDALERLSENRSDIALRDGIVKHCADPMLIPPLDHKWADDEDMDDGYGNEFFDTYYNCVPKGSNNEMNWLAFFEQEHTVKLDVKQWKLTASASSFPSFCCGASSHEIVSEMSTAKPDRQTMENDIDKTLNVMFISGTLSLRLLQTVGGFVYAKARRTAGASFEKKKVPPVTITQLAQCIHSLSISDLGALWCWIRVQFKAKQHLMVYTLKDQIHLPPSEDGLWYSATKDANGEMALKFSTVADSPVSLLTDDKLLEEILKDEHVDQPEKLYETVLAYLMRQGNWKLDDKFAANHESAKNCVHYFDTFSDLVRDVLMIFNVIVTSPLLKPDERFQSEELSQELHEMVMNAWLAMKFFDVTEFRIRKNSFSCELIDHRTSDQSHLELIRPSPSLVDYKPKDFNKMQFLQSLNDYSAVRENTLKLATGYVVDYFDANVVSGALSWLEQLSCADQSSAEMLKGKMEHNQSIADELKEIRDFAQSLPARAATLIALAQRHLMDAKLKLEILSCERIQLCMKIFEDSAVNLEGMLRSFVNSALKAELLNRAKAARENIEQTLMADISAAERESQAKEERKSKSKEKEKAKKQARKEAEKKEKEDRERNEREKLEMARKKEEEKLEAERQAAKAVREARLREQDALLEKRRIELEEMSRAADLEEAKRLRAETEAEEARQRKAQADEARRRAEAEAERRREAEAEAARRREAEAEAVRRREAEAEAARRRKVEVKIERESIQHHDSAASVSSPDKGEKSKDLDDDTSSVTTDSSDSLASKSTKGKPKAPNKLAKEKSKTPTVVQAPMMPPPPPPPPVMLVPQVQAPPQYGQYMQPMMPMPIQMMPQTMFYAPAGMHLPIAPYYAQGHSIPSQFEQQPAVARVENENANASFAYAVVKTLWHVERFRDGIIDAPTQRRENNSDVKALRMLKCDFIRLVVGFDEQYTADALCKTLANLGLFDVSKRGPAALYSFMMKTFHKGLKPLNASPKTPRADQACGWLDVIDGYQSIVHKYFGHDLTETTSCVRCSKHSKKQYTQFITALPASRLTDDKARPFAETLKAHKVVEDLCESCGEVTASSKTVRLLNDEPPHILAFGLIWGSTFADPDVIQRSFDSISGQLLLSDVLDVPENCECADEEYYLKAVMCSRGAFEYLTLIKHSATEDLWDIECDANREMIPTNWNRAAKLCKQGQTAPKVLFYERRKAQ